jgi:hypothetical protein
MSRLISQAQYSRRAGLSTGYISQLVKRRIILLVDGKIDPDQADAGIKANVDRSRQAKSDAAKKRWKYPKSKISESPQMNFLPRGSNGYSSNCPQSLTETRQQHEAVKMELTKLKLEIEKGNLVHRNQAEQWLSSIIDKARSHLLGFPKRLAGPLAIMTDEKEIEQELRKEIRRVLEEMGSQNSLREEEDANGKQFATSGPNPC